MLILPASDPLHPILKEVLRGETQILVPWMYHDGATAGPVSRMAIGLPIQWTSKVRGCRDGLD